jgi:elongation of very long chain fatty acids protein 4
VLDFADTFFIVWRGKWDQFSFLHIYHHFSIFLTYWLVANAGYDGDVYYTIVANRCARWHPLPLRGRAALA